MGLNCQKPECLHETLNHLPPVGQAVGSLAVVVALAPSSHGAALGSFVPVALMAASAWPVLRPGESTYNCIRAISDSGSVALLKQQMLLAGHWVWLCYLAALAAIAAVGVVWKHPAKQRLAGLAVVAIAKLAGEVRHPESRSGPTLVSQDTPEEHSCKHQR